MALKVDASSNILFVGDSITDAHRAKDPEKLGRGYVRIIRDFLLARDPANAPRVINRGISGNQVSDLQRRWDRDVLQMRPDVVSISVGLNDVWHNPEFPLGPNGIEAFTAGYQDLVARTRKALPGAAIVLCEPTVLWVRNRLDTNAKLIHCIEAIHSIARQFEVTCVVALHEAFERACRAHPEIRWTLEGVHPTDNGHMLIARTWLAATGLL
jgi:acyl-CoA thioesterase-1